MAKYLENLVKIVIDRVSSLIAIITCNQEYSKKRHLNKIALFCISDNLLLFSPNAFLF